jgi:dUTPase
MAIPEKFENNLIDWVSDLAKAINLIAAHLNLNPNSNIKFLKTREVKSPSRANKHDAGIDFYVPEFTVEFLKDLRAKNPDLDDSQITKQGIYLNSGHRILIPSGIHCQMTSPGRALIAANKSGVATKTGLIFGAQVVDFEYQGEIHISLIYTGNGTVEILPGMKAIQFLETPIFNSEILISETLSVETFYKTSTTRGADGFGSTDKK